MKRLPRKDRIKIHKRGLKLEVEHVESGDIAMWCYIGDDLNTESMADFLSSKNYPEAAMEVRRLVREERRAVVR